MSKIELVPVSKNPVNKIVIKGDWNDEDYITDTFPYDEKHLSGLALLEKVFSDTDKLETVDGRRYALDIREDFDECFKRFIKFNVVDEVLKNKLLNDDGLIDYLSDFIPYESNSGLRSHSLKISILKDGIEYRIKNFLSVDELFNKLFKDNNWDDEDDWDELS